MNATRLKLLVSIVAILLIILHLIWPKLAIDSVSALLLAIAILPWLNSLFKSIELPGGIKVEYRDLEQATKTLTKSGMVSLDIPTSKSESQRTKYAFMNVLDSKSNLMLMTLRMEIESRLERLLKQEQISAKRGIVSAIKALRSNNRISHEEASALLEIIPILNKASHNQSIDPAVHEWAVFIGPQILESLDAKLGQEDLADLIQKYENRDGGQAVEIGSLISKKLIMNTEVFFDLFDKHQKVFEEWLADLEMSTFTMFEARDEVDEIIIGAKYEKLKELMLEKTKQYLEFHPNHKTSLRVLDKLKIVEIKSIW